MVKILSISLELNFIPNTLRCYGLNQDQRFVSWVQEASVKLREVIGGWLDRSSEI